MIEGVKLNGQSYSKIAKTMPKKSQEEIRTKIRQIKLHPDKHKKFADILPIL